MATAISEPRSARIDPLYLIMGSSSMALLTNRIPALAIAATVATLMFGVWAWLLRGKVLAITARPLGLLICLYLYFVASYFMSNQPLSGFLTYDFIKHDGNFFFAYIMFFAFTSPAINYRTLFLVYHNFMLTVFAAFALLGFAEYLTGVTHLVSRSDWGQFLFVGLNKAHNATGSAYAAACVVVLAAILFSERGSKRRFLAIFGCCVLGLLLTKSRGSLVAFSAATVFLYRLRYGSWRAIGWRMGAFAVLLIAALLFTGGQSRIASAMNPDEDMNIFSRFVQWRNATVLIKESPLVGVGFGRFNDICAGNGAIDVPTLHGVHGIAAMATSAEQISDDSHAHNSYLQFLSETGILGLGLLLAFWLSIFGRLKKGFRAASGDPLVRVAAAAGMANIVLLFVLSLTENYMSATTVMLFMSASVGMGLALVGQTTARSST